MQPLIKYKLIICMYEPNDLIIINKYRCDLRGSSCALCSSFSGAQRTPRIHKEHKERERFRYADSQ